MSTYNAPLLISLFGPTAVGKSALAIELCQAVGGEIVTADSRQVYRYMDIGTDKPTLEQRRVTPHHMIDLVDPDEPYTLALYQEGATRVIDEIWRPGALPRLPGGTPPHHHAVNQG